MKKLIPVLMLLLGTGAGVGAGIMMKPAETPEEASQEETTEKPEETETGTAEAPTETNFVSLANQFVVPVVGDDRVNALVILSLTLEVAEGGTEATLAKEAKLRDVFLEVLFDHANMGGFEGVFTRAGNIHLLRQSLRDAAIGVLGDIAVDVLITDIIRQDT